MTAVCILWAAVGLLFLILRVVEANDEIRAATGILAVLPPSYTPDEWAAITEAENALRGES